MTFPWGRGVLPLAAAGFTAWILHAAGVQAEKGRQELQQLRADLDTQKRINTATAVALSARVESKARIQTLTKEIIREIPIRIPSPACPLPGEWRLLHDAAAEGVAPQPAGHADATALTPQEAAGTVAENYGQCRDLANQLTQLQRWVREMSK